MTTDGGSDRERLTRQGDAGSTPALLADTDGDRGMDRRRGPEHRVETDRGPGTAGGLEPERGPATDTGPEAGGSHRAENAVPDTADEAAAAIAAREAGAGRRTTVVVRYLLGCLAVDHVRRLTGWAWLVPVVGLGLLLVRPRLIGLAVIALGVAVVAARFAALRLLRRVSLPTRFRPVEGELRAAVEAGKANLRVELRRVSLPSRSWHLAVFVLRLGRGSARAQARSRLREVDVDRVLPLAQLDRALRLLDDAASSPR